MKIRNLNQYIDFICEGKSTPRALGTDDDRFLKALYGERKSIESVITGAASFASQAKEQLFYEFVQNAYDAKADSLFFFADEKFLIVLNNGEPFYTDLDKNVKNLREGQLYSFLAKGQSQKLHNEETLGKYGQGSKLLYTLLADEDDYLDIETLLNDAIIKRKKGPYIISWANMAQLDALLVNKDEWIPADTEDVKHNILFTKIMMSYYPVLPGENENWFKNEEALTAINAFDTLVQPRRNKFFLNRGTALIIPLGKGKYDSIKSEDNMSNVMDRLGGFASITARQSKNRHTHLNHIYVFGQEITQYETEDVQIDFIKEGKEFHYYFAFNKEFADKNTVNFYKGLPIIETKFKLGFIVDSDAFEVDDSRQRITDTDKTGKQIRCAYEHLVEQLEIIKEETPERFLKIYECIPSSKVLNIKNDEIKSAFDDVLMEFIKSNVLTATGTFVPMEKVYVNSDGLNFQLEEIGITDKFWADPVIAVEINRHLGNSNLPYYPLEQLLEDASPVLLEQWIQNCTQKDYNDFIAKVLPIVEKVPSLNLFVSNKKNLYSWNDLQSDSPIFFKASIDGLNFSGCEYIEYPLIDEADDNYYELIISKFQKNIETLRSKNQIKETICQICSTIYDCSNGSLQYQIAYNMPVLKNSLDEYRTFDKLFLNRPADTVLFDRFIVSGYVPECSRREDWFINNTDKETMKKWVSENFDKLKLVPDWDKYTIKYLQDIRAVCPDKCEPFLTLYLNENGVPSANACYSLENMIQLSEEEYMLIVETFNEYDFVPYKYFKDLTTSPFKLNCLTVDELLDYANLNNMHFDFNVLKIFNKVGNQFISTHRFIEIGDLFEVTGLRYGKNYYDKIEESLRAELTQIGFYHVPDKIQTLYENGRNYLTLRNKEYISRIIEKIQNKLLLLPIVKESDNETIEMYFRALDTIDVTRKLSPQSPEWQIIRLAAERNLSNYDLKQRILELYLCKSRELPQNIIDKTVIIGNNAYNVYDLIDQYREENEIIEDFRDLLPTIGDADQFINTFYEGRMTNIEPLEIYESLYGCYLNIEQLRFCIDYSLKNNALYKELEISDDESLTEALNMVRDNNFKNFDIYFAIEDYDPDKVYAPDNLLTVNEILPTELKSWISQNEDSIGLFSKLRTIQDPHIAMRKAVLENNRFVDIPTFNSELSDYDIEWFNDSDQEIAFESPAFDTIRFFQETVPEGYDNEIMLRYTGKLKETDLQTKTFIPYFSIALYNSDGYLLDSKSWNEMFCDLLRTDQKLQRFFQENTVYYFETENETFLKMQLESPEFMEINLKAKEGSYKELATAPYLKWKTLPDSKGILVKVSDEPIGVEFTLDGDEKVLYKKQLENQDFGYEQNKSVIVRYPNGMNMDVMTTISAHISSMDFFKEPFIALQTMYLENYNKLEKIAESTGRDVSSIVQDSIDNLASNESDSNNLHVDDDKLQAIKEIAEKFDPNMMVKLIEKKDIIEDIIDQLGDEDESMESQVRAIIGYIGEQIYCRYLDNLNKEYDYAAGKGIGAYDIYNKTDNTYLDIKTTAYSLKDGTAPFYLHKSQNKFMEDYPDAEYHIVRISLQDLSLIKAYENVRDTYGKDSSPNDNPRLKKECDKIAKTYWRGAEIDEFDNFSPEYSIKIEKK